MRVAKSILILTLLVIPLGIAVYSCAGEPGGGIDNAAMLPAGDYIGVIGFKPVDINNSGFYKRVVEGFGEQGEGMKGQFEVNASDLGLKFEEIKELTLFIHADFQDMLAILDAPTTPEKLVKARSDKTGAKFEKLERDGTEYWVDEGSEEAVMNFAGALFLGQRDSLEALISAEETLAGEEAFIKARGLANAGATVYGLYWGDLSMVSDFAGFLLAQVEGGAEAVEALGSLEALGFSVYVRDDLAVKIKLMFTEKADVDKLAEFFNLRKKELVEQGAGAMRMFMPFGIESESEPETGAAADLVEKIKFSANGNILEIDFKMTYEDIESLTQESSGEN